MSNKRTIKALEELVKTEYMAVAALDSALESTDDSRVRKNYRKWRDSHMKQAEALNGRIEDVMRFENFKGEVRKGFAGLPDPFSILTNLRPR